MGAKAQEDLTEVLNDLISSQLTIKDEEVSYKDIQIFEELFCNNRERSYNALDVKATTDLLIAVKEIPCPQKKFQCSHCEEVFISKDFQAHVCMFDENHVMIPMEELPQSEPETELKKIFRNSMELLTKNQSSLTELYQKATNKVKDSSFECSKCCRKFVHESGLFRHWDKHIGELLSPSPAEDSDFCRSVTLCTICHEVFSLESEAWDHYIQKRHFEGSSKDDREKLSEQLAGNDSVDESLEPPGKKVKIEIQEISLKDEEINSAEELIKANKSTELISQKLKEHSTQVIPKAIRQILFGSESPIALKTVYISKLFQCEFCDLIFFSGPAMLKHVSNHDPINAFECNKCELKQLTLKEILLHRRDECVIFRDYRNPLRDFSRIWVCNVCEEEFHGLELLMNHRHTLHHFFPRISAKENQLYFSCERCITHFKTAPEIVDHFNDKHLKTPKLEAVAKTSERIAKPSSMSRGGVHQTSTRARMYLCEVCGKSYTQSSHLWQHLRFHQGVKPFGCSIEGCDRRFTIRPDLNDHIRKCHTGERPYLCIDCGKRFLTGSVYYQHRLIHRGERRYGCEECGKRFYRADALKNHLRIHTGEKPHTCSICFKAFRQRGDRDKHVKARHPNVLYISSPKRQRIKSFGRGRVKNNTSLYCSMPGVRPLIPEP